MKRVALSSLPFIALSRVPVLLLACSGAGAMNDVQTAQEVYLGPDQAATIDLTNPRVLYSIGDSAGPGMLTEGRGLLMEPIGGDDVLVYTSFSESVQLFRNGQFVSKFGRPGRGPGEFTKVGGFTMDEQRDRIWLLDTGGGRLISFARDGTPGEVVPATHAGANARQPRFLPDGSVVLNGPGGNQRNMGYLIHRYDPTTKAWSSYHPVLRDSAFNVNDRLWIRSLAVAPDGKLIAVSHDYVIEVLDPNQDFRLLARIRRRPTSWPEDVHADNARRLREDRLSPRFNVTNAWIDSQNRLWVVGSMPDRHWRAKVGKDPSRPWEERSLAGAIDWGIDVVVEVIDLASLRVLQSHRLDEYGRYVIGIGLVAWSARDLPFPQVDVLEIPVPEEAS